MTQRPDARPEPTPDALPLDLLPPLDRDSQITRPNPPGGEHRPVLQPEEPAGSAGGAGARLDLLPTRLLIGKGGETRSIWPVHLAGWRALGWEVLTPVLPAVVEPGQPGEPEQPGEQGPEPEGPELEPDPGLEAAPDLEAQQPVLPETADPGPVPPDPEQPGGEAVEESPQPAEPPAPEATPAPEVPDFAAMTKAEIIEHCSRHYSVLLDSSLTKSVLVSEAETLAAPRLPDALMDDLMT
ncbi:MAG: hypothetical protein R6V05_00750 [Candidatus Brocadiia bacterium]